jgi:tetratricopeptide (TPR) repeat protein
MREKFMIKKLLLIFLFFIFNFNLFAVQQEKLDEVIKLINLGKNDDAINILKSYNEDGEILLAIAYLGKKDFVNAKICALQSYYKNNDDVVANYILAQICEEQKDYDNAIKHWYKVFSESKDRSVKMLAKKHYDVLKMLKK